MYRYRYTGRSTAGTGTSYTPGATAGFETDRPKAGTGTASGGGAFPAKRAEDPAFASDGGEDEEPDRDRATRPRGVPTSPSRSSKISNILQNLANVS